MIFFIDIKKVKWSLQSAKVWQGSSLRSIMKQTTLSFK